MDLERLDEKWSLLHNRIACGNEVKVTMGDVKEVCALIAELKLQEKNREVHLAQIEAAIKRIDEHERVIELLKDYESRGSLRVDRHTEKLGLHQHVIRDLSDRVEKMEEQVRKILDLEAGVKRTIDMWSDMVVRVARLEDVTKRHGLEFFDDAQGDEKPDDIRIRPGYPESAPPPADYSHEGTKP